MGPLQSKRGFTKWKAFLTLDFLFLNISTAPQINIPSNKLNIFIRYKFFPRLQTHLLYYWSPSFIAVSKPFFPIWILWMNEQLHSYLHIPTTGFSGYPGLFIFFNLYFLKIDLTCFTMIYHCWCNPALFKKIFCGVSHSPHISRPSVYRCKNLTSR